MAALSTCRMFRFQPNHVTFVLYVHISAKAVTFPVNKLVINRFKNNMVLTITNIL
jgi:hypothetical protein